MAEKTWAEYMASTYAEAVKAGRYTEAGAEEELRRTWPSSADAIIRYMSEELKDSITTENGSPSLPRTTILEPAAVKSIERGVEWDLKGQYKSMDELIAGAKAQQKMFHGGGWYGVSFDLLIPFLEKMEKGRTNPGYREAAERPYQPLTKKDDHDIAVRGGLGYGHREAYMEFMPKAFPGERDVRYASEWAERFRLGTHWGAADKERRAVLREVYKVD